MPFQLEAFKSVKLPKKGASRSEWQFISFDSCHSIFMFHPAQVTQARYWVRIDPDKVSVADALDPDNVDVTEYALDPVLTDGQPVKFRFDQCGTKLTMYILGRTAPIFENVDVASQIAIVSVDHTYGTWTMEADQLDMNVETSALSCGMDDTPAPVASTDGIRTAAIVAASAAGASLVGAAAALLVRNMGRK
jgi:hypothetical protein